MDAPSSTSVSGSKPSFSEDFTKFLVVSSMKNQSDQQSFLNDFEQFIKETQGNPCNVSGYGIWFFSNSGTF